MLENKIAGPPGDDLEQFFNQRCAFLGRDMRLAAEALPDLFASEDDVGVGLRGFTLLGELLLLTMGLG